MGRLDGLVAMAPPLSRTVGESKVISHAFDSRRARDRRDEPNKRLKEPLMSPDNVTPMHKPVQFTIDGRSYETADRRQQAAAILRLAGLDPSLFDLGELQGHRPQPVRFEDDELVEIHPGARFVSIRQRADVA
jgi:hypothetical protein